MLKILRVGDPHITVRNIQESQRLMDFIIEKAYEYDVSHVEFMGDLTHNHAVIRVEVQDFWKKAFDRLKQGFYVIALTGNHDQPGSKEKEQEMNSLNVFHDRPDQESVIARAIDIVNAPMILNNIAYIPYMSDHQEFIKAAQELYNEGATKLLVAHQNFTIALYSDMIDPNLIPQEAIVTGHIHEQRQVGKVFQPGTPKWDTMSDANEDKGMWYFEHNEDGSVASKEFISTKNVVAPIVKFTMNEGDQDVTLDDNARNYLELIGSSAWIVQMKKKYKGLASIKARPLDRKSSSLNKDKAFSILEYLDSAFKPIDGIEKTDIRQYLKEVLNAQ